MTASGWDTPFEPTCPAKPGSSRSSIGSRHKDGSYRWRLTRGVAVRDPAGRPIRLIGSSVDITDLKRAEDALRASEQRFRTFVDHATDAFFLQDDQLVVVDVNRQACRSLGTRGTSWWG